MLILQLTLFFFYFPPVKCDLGYEVVDSMNYQQCRKCGIGYYKDDNEALRCSSCGSMKYTKDYGEKDGSKCFGLCLSSLFYRLSFYRLYFIVFNFISLFYRFFSFVSFLGRLQDCVQIDIFYFKRNLSQFFYHSIKLTILSIILLQEAHHSVQRFTSHQWISISNLMIQLLPISSLYLKKSINRYVILLIDLRMMTFSHKN